MRELSRLAPVLLLLALTGCAALGGSARPRPSADPAEEAAEAATRDRIAELQRQAAMAEAEIRLLRQNLAALQVEVERLSAEAERAAIPPPVPSGAGGSSFEVSDLEPVRVAPQVATVPPSAASKEVDSGEPEVPAEEADAPVPLAGQSIYDRGYTLYHQGRYLDAESSFQRFLQAHGDTELADNAQFWIGESRFAREDYSGALLAFQEVLDRYPGGNKVGDALLKTGDCLARLGDPAAAAERYGEVMRRFPGSAAAVMAEERTARRRQ